MAFKAKYGHCDVPLTGENASLGSWCSQLRVLYKKSQKENKPKKKLSDEQIQHERMQVSSGLYRLCQRMVQGIKVQCLTSASMISWSDVEHLFISPRFLKTQSTKRHYFSYFLIMPTYTSGSTGKPVYLMYELKKILLRRSIQYTCTSAFIKSNIV